MASLATLYVGGLLWLTYGLSKLKKKISRQKPLHGTLPAVAVVVAARNEADNLPRLIECLVNQDYPAEKLQICIVDDRSEDRTPDILTRAAKNHPNLKTIRINEMRPGWAPKKRAIDTGIRNTTGELILLTDADCIPPPTWIKTMVAFYEPTTALVAGYSPYRFPAGVPRLLQGMMALDNFSLAAISAASTGLGRPLTVTGTNLSYPRKIYNAIGGLQPIAKWISGDDDLFMQEIAKRRLGKFSYALTPSAFVPAAGPKNWRKFWHQRIRYASKSRHYPLLMILGLVAVYGFNTFILIGSLSLLFFSSSTGFLALMLWLTKATGEYYFLRKAAIIFKEKALLKYFLPAQLIHPLYIIVFGLLGIFLRFQWKGKKYEKTLELPLAQ